jgi:ElaA protein
MDGSEPLADSLVDWRWNTIDDIAPRDLLGLLALRSAVFVVEQRCPFLDVDDADLTAWHLVGRIGGRMVATLRLLPPGVRYRDASIGRVCTAIDQRGTGLGRALMEQGLAGAGRFLPGVALRISAQQHLQGFYESLGFTAVSDPYDEDGIAHVEMWRPAPTAPRKG